MNHFLFLVAFFALSPFPVFYACFFRTPMLSRKGFRGGGEKKNFRQIDLLHAWQYIRTYMWLIPSFDDVALFWRGKWNSVDCDTTKKNYIWLVLRFFQEPAKRLRAYLVSKYFITKTRWRRCFYLRKLAPSKKTSNLFSSIFSRFYTVSVLCVLHDPNKSWLVTIFLPNERKRRRRRHEINKANWCNSYSFFFFPFSNFDNKKRPQPALSLLVILDSFLRHPSSL